jgi:nitrite reductase (NO-forming)
MSMRRAPLALGNALVIVYSAVALVMLARDEKWLALHVFVLGGMTTAVMLWGEHFAVAVLHASGTSSRDEAVRLAVANVGSAAVLFGVHSGRAVETTVGGAVLGTAVAHYALGLLRARRSGLGGRLSIVVWFYLAAALFLGAGGVLGVALATGRAGSSYRSLRLAHAHLTLLGWVVLTVLGTLFTLWPTVLRTRIAANTVRAARATWALAMTGVPVAAVGFATRARYVAAAGLALVLAAVVVALGPFVDAVRRRTPHNAASWFLAGGTAWLVAVVAADVLQVLGSDPLVDVDRSLGRVVVAAVAGFVAQTLVGALTYLLPTVWGRGPQGNRRLARVLEAGWQVRFVLANVGVVLLTMPAVPRVGRAVAWPLVAIGLGGFLPLSAAAFGWFVVEGVTPGDPYRPLSAEARQRVSGGVAVAEPAGAEPGECGGDGAHEQQRGD